MSKPVKEMIVADYRKRFADLDDALLVDVRGIGANDNNTLRLDLARKAIRVTVLKNSLARQAFSGTALEALRAALDGPSALVYGADSAVAVARELVEWAGRVENLSLKAAVLDGQLFEGDAGVRRLSEYPTKEEAHARIVQLALTPAGNLLAAAKSPGSRIMGIVKEIQTRLERGESVTRTT